MERSSADNSPSQLAVRRQNRANCSSPSPPGRQTRPRESRSRVKTAESRYAAVLQEVLSSQLRLQTCGASPRRDLRPLKLVLRRLRLPRHRRGVRGTPDRSGGYGGERRGAGSNRLRGKQRGGDRRGSPRRGSERRARSVEQRGGTRRGQGNRRRRGRHFYCLFDSLAYLWG